MKLMQTLFVGAVLAFASVAAHAADPLIGTWTLNAAKSKFSGPAPKSMVRTYAAQGDKIVMSVKIVNADGKEVAQSSTYSQDGKDAPFVGSSVWDTLSVTATGPNSARFVQKKDGKVVGTGTRTVSADGKTLTLVQHGAGADASKVLDTIVLDRK